MAKEMLFSDMGGCFGPKTGISPYGRKDKWRQLPYRAGAISGTVKQPHVIDNAKCVKCGACMDKCKFGAISKQ